MESSILKHMSRANTHTHPVDHDMVEHVVGQLQSEVTMVHEEAWQRTAEECQRDLSLVDFAFDQTTGASEVASALWTKLEALKRDIEWCRTLHRPSPIRTLPLEVLSYIFTLASVDDFYDVVNTQTAGSRPAGHTFIQVSKYWRDAALQTKGVWSHPIVVNRHVGRGFPTLSENKADRCIKRLTSVISLYGSNLTHVSLHCKHFPFRMRLLFDLVLQLQFQLVSLDLVGAGSVIFSQPFEFDMPLLKRLFLPNDAAIPEDVTFKTPKLKKLFLFDPETPQDIGGLSIPHQQLTHLSVGIPYTAFVDSFVLPINTMRKLPAMLFGARNLVYLHLTGLLPPSTPAPVLLPQLKVLEIHDRDLRLLRGPWGATSECTYFPFTISAPALEKFDLAFSVDDQRPLGMEESQRIAQPFLQTFETIGYFLRDALLLSQVRMIVCFGGGFLGHQWDDRNGTSSGQVLQRGIYQITGDRDSFTQLARAWAGSGDDHHFNHQVGRAMMYTDQLASEVWMDRFIDRCVQRWPDPDFAFRECFYSRLEKIVLGSVYDLFGESGGLPGRCERQVFHSTSTLTGSLAGSTGVTPM